MDSKIEFDHTEYPCQSVENRRLVLTAPEESADHSGSVMLLFVVDLDDEGNVLQERHVALAPEHCSGIIDTLRLFVQRKAN